MSSDVTNRVYANLTVNLIERLVDKGILNREDVRDVVNHAVSQTATSGSEEYREAEEILRNSLRGVV